MRPEETDFLRELPRRRDAHGRAFRYAWLRRQHRPSPGSEGAGVQDHTGDTSLFPGHSRRTGPEHFAAGPADPRPV